MHTTRPDATAPRGDSHPPLRVAVVTETYPPEVNGVALTVARLVEGLRARGHRIQVVRVRRDGASPSEDELLLPGIPLPFYRELRMGLPAAAHLEMLWQADRPDLVHVATEGPLGLSALRAARRLGLPVTSDFRTNFHAYSGHYGVAWLRGAITAYLRWFHNRTDCTMVPTESLRGELEESGFRRMEVVGRGVDVTRFDPRFRDTALRASWGAGDGDIVMLYVGRIAAEKNLDVLFDAWSAVLANASRHGRRVRLVLVGDGPLRESLEARWPEAIFAGQRSGEDLARHFASGDLFVFPSLTETWGNVTTEALASGLPVLAWKHAAAGELVVPWRNGVVVSPGDAGAFTRAAIELVSDAGRLVGMGDAARLTAQQLGWDAILASAESILYSTWQRGALFTNPSSSRRLPFMRGQ